MKEKYLYLLLFLSLCINNFSAAQNKSATSHVLVYKKIDTTQLKLEVYNPTPFDPQKSYPVIVFFFGGGWRSGSTEQFQPHARYFASRGLVCVLVNYRVKDRNGTSPLESLKDAKSAIRYIRKNAAQLHIDTGKVIAAGGSAGGQLAAATAYPSEINEATDDLSVSTKPNALVLFNPAIDNGPGGAGYELVGEQYKNFSPLHNIRKGLPPAIFFLGTNDDIVPVETAKYYKKAYEKTGNRLELRLYEGQAHGFFNLKKSTEYYARPHIYDYDSCKIKLSTIYPYNREHAPSSTLQSTVLDFCKYAMFHLNKGTYQNHELLKKEVYSILWDTAAVANWSEVYKYYGAGWFIGNLNGQKIIHHSGNDHGFRANFILLPDENISITIVSNYYQTRVLDLGQQIASILTQQNYTAENLSDDLNEFKGKYCNDSNCVEIAVQQDHPLSLVRQAVTSCLVPAPYKGVFTGKYLEGHQVKPYYSPSNIWLQKNSDPSGEKKYELRINKEKFRKVD